MRMSTVWIAGAAVLVAAAAVWGVGLWSWRHQSQTLGKRLDAAREPLVVTRFHRSELAGLPTPVQRYFEHVLTDGQPIIAAAHFSHSGSFNMGETEARWAPFHSQQTVITRRPGFDWDGRIEMGYGLHVRVHDAYVAGQGLLVAKMMGVIPLADQRGTPALAQGEFMRWLAEACWYPTALLPSQGVLWEAVDAESARATFSDGDNRSSVVFHFAADGAIQRISAAARARVVGGQTSLAPWQVRLWAYEERSGMQVPAEGEVAWLLPSGPYAYWRGHLGGVHYEWAQ